MSEMTVKPCPFCGFEIDLGERDMLVPTSFWKSKPNGERVYLGMGRGLRTENLSDCNRVWEIRCSFERGGCGATMSGDSITEVINNWNKRVNENA